MVVCIMQWSCQNRPPSAVEASPDLLPSISRGQPIPLALFSPASFPFTPLSREHRGFLSRFLHADILKMSAQAKGKGKKPVPTSLVSTTGDLEGQPLMLSLVSGMGFHLCTWPETRGLRC